ncbi:MAG: hypothetical protein K0U98_23525 [Deltaproteobacteria bacterium]|nr:hypothetical protein [Deltaproteobacteria bacterium]
MPIETTIDSVRGIVVQRVQGELDSNDVIEAQKRLYLDPDHDPALPVLWDTREGSASSMPFGEMENLVDRSEKLWENMGQGRTAILVASEADFGMGRMYQALADQMPRRLAVFYDYEEAIAWLSEA